MRLSDIAAAFYIYDRFTAKPRPKPKGCGCILWLVIFGAVVAYLMVTRP